MSNKDFDSIMREITSGLSGDFKQDIEYLQSQTEKYKDHEFGIEIARACGRLMFELIPDDKKEELNKAIGKDMLGYEAILDEVRFKIYQKDHAGALKIMEALVSKYEELNMFADDSVSEYHNFKEFMEEILYRHIYKPEKDLRRAEIDYAEIYLLYGSLLFELGRHEDAIAALEKAMKWNPMSASLAFEHAENYKALGKLAEYEKCTREIFKIAYKPNDLARCYRNLGYLYVENGEYDLAVCCETFSLQFEKSNLVQSELYYISTKTGKVFDPTLEDIQSAFETNGIPFGPDGDVMGIAYTYGKHFFDEKEYNAAAYFLDIFAGFVNDDEVNQMLEVAVKNMEE